jgi:hypothetical protein
MKKPLKAILVAAVVSASPFAAVAQPMDTELTMLEQAVHNAFSRYGVSEYKMEDLTLGQLAEIKGIVGSGDDSGGDKKAQIMQVIERGTTN